MKKIAFCVVLIMSMFVHIGRVSANAHKVLLLGDSLTLTGWVEMVNYDHTVVAKGSQTTDWVLSQLDTLVTTGEIDRYDTAVVWIGANNSPLAVEGIPEIYKILHDYGIKIVGVTLYYHNYRDAVPPSTLAKISEFDEIVRTQADVVVDLARNPAIVDDKGFVKLSVAPDGIHPSLWSAIEVIATEVNRALDELYIPTPTPEPTVTNTPTPESTATATFVPTVTSELPTREGSTMLKVTTPSENGTNPDTDVATIALVIIFVGAVAVLLRLVLKK
jgi:hypothetical protein